MNRVGDYMAQGRDAYIAHRFCGLPLHNPYNLGTRAAQWWSRGVERARGKVAELMAIGR